MARGNIGGGFSDLMWAVRQGRGQNCLLQPRVNVDFDRGHRRLDGPIRSDWGGLWLALELRPPFCLRLNRPVSRVRGGE